MWETIFSVSTNFFFFYILTAWDFWLCLFAFSLNIFSYRLFSISSSTYLLHFKQSQIPDLDKVPHHLGTQLFETFKGNKLQPLLQVPRRCCSRVTQLDSLVKGMYLGTENRRKMSFSVFLCVAAKEVTR